MQTSNGLADRLVVPGAEAYVKKIYTTVGVANTSLEKAIILAKEDLQKYIFNKYSKKFKKTTVINF